MFALNDTNKIRSMKNYKVTLNLMKDPTRGDATFPFVVNVVAKDKNDAYNKASFLQDNCLDLKIKRSTVFDYKVEEITTPTKN